MSVGDSSARQPAVTGLLTSAERLLSRFEDAWRQNLRPQVEDFLPREPDARRAILAGLVRIDLGWRLTAGEAVRVENYLRRYPELEADPAAILELVVREYAIRRQQEPHLRPASYLERFPQLGEALLQRLETFPSALTVSPPAAEVSRLPAPAASVASQEAPSKSELVRALCDSRFLSRTQQEELCRLQSLCADARTLVREVVRRGWYTPYQVSRLAAGRGDELLLGQYILLDLLGEGGMGRVFKARHRHLGRVVAIKVIHQDRLKDEETVRRFAREVQAVAQLAHPGLVAAYDAEQSGQVHCLVMEYVEGTDLSKIVKQSGPLPVDLACAYVQQAALALQHAHERGLVHRDVKPSNLLLTRPHGEKSFGKTAAGAVKLLDLGLARFRWSAEENLPAGDLTRVGVVIGTPDFMSPEQIVDARTVDPRSDLYSLGCTFYFLLTGQVPFPGALFAKLALHQTADPRPVEDLRPDVPAELAAVVRKLMAKRPQDRYQTAAELATDLEAFVPATPSLVPPSPEPANPWTALEEKPARLVTAPSRERRTPRWAPSLMAACATGLLLLVCAAFFLVWLHRSPRPTTPWPGKPAVKSTIK